MAQNNDSYWAANIRLIVKLLLVWFVVSFLCGIVFVEALNNIQIAGFKLGFWFAQQGSILSFVVLIFYYVRKMDQLDQDYDVDE